MTTKKIKTTAPGKIMISGEWSVLETDNPCIVAAINLNSYAEIEPADKILISIPEYGIERQPPNSEDADKFISSAIKVCGQYLSELKPFHIITTKDNTEKLGLGSSASITVAATKAILEFHKKQVNKKAIFKLSAIAHYLAQNNIGSCFDIAASTYGGVIAYKRFNPGWLTAQLKNKSIKEIINTDWPDLKIESLNMPNHLNLLVGWTQQPASTTEMIKQLNKWKTLEPEKYNNIIIQISNTTNNLIQAWKDNNQNNILNLIKQNHELLAKLGTASNTHIETPLLKTLSDIADKYGAGKLSGAGGGDCGIAITYIKENTEKIQKEWQENGIIPLKTDIFTF